MLRDDIVRAIGNATGGEEVRRLFPETYGKAADAALKVVNDWLNSEEAVERVATTIEREIPGRYALDRRIARAVLRSLREGQA